MLVDKYLHPLYKCLQREGRHLTQCQVKILRNSKIKKEHFLLLIWWHNVGFGDGRMEETRAQRTRLQLKSLRNSQKFLNNNTFHISHMKSVFAKEACIDIDSLHTCIVCMHTMQTTYSISIYAKMHQFQKIQFQLSLISPLWHKCCSFPYLQILYHGQTALKVCVFLGQVSFSWISIKALRYFIEKLEHITWDISFEANVKWNYCAKSKNRSDLPSFFLVFELLLFAVTLLAFIIRWYLNASILSDPKWVLSTPRRFLDKNRERKKRVTLGQTLSVKCTTEHHKTRNPHNLRTALLVLNLGRSTLQRINVRHLNCTLQSIRGFFFRFWRIKCLFWQNPK